ncbi:MAG TPA: hypothetical protein VH082_13420 [Rudaea sp.]|jgi:hypothetical protein|nr:hypothetical protein [Rudaea sp.]
MTMGLRCGLVVSLVLASTAASAQTLTSSPIIFSAGVWDVHRTTDMMTDATVCTSIYKNNFGVQLGENTMTIAIADGVKNVQLRFDDATPQTVRPATLSEFKNNRIEITGSDFAEMLDSRRMRYEVTTGTNGTASGDIDLNGVFQTHDNVRAGCAGSPVAKVAPATRDTCSQGVRDRMSQKGVAPQDIQDICSTPVTE